MTHGRRRRDSLEYAELQGLFADGYIMAMPVARARRWTLDEVQRLVEERPGYSPRYELVDGELLVTAAPNRKHQRMVAEAFWLLRPFVEANGLGETLMSPGEVRLTPTTRFEPDVYVIPLVGGRRLALSETVTQLVLAVEVLSTSSARHDRVTKRRFFQRTGVPNYWIIDGDAELFEIWQPGDDQPTIADRELVWRPSASSEALTVDVTAFFAAVADEPA